jgi:hypothetical protein
MILGYQHPIAACLCHAISQQLLERSPWESVVANWTVVTLKRTFGGVDYD